MKRRFFRKKPENGFAIATFSIGQIEAEATELLGALNSLVMQTARGRTIVAKTLSDVEPLAVATTGAHKKLEELVAALRALQGEVRA